uniref:Uncharacterized protein n=1 Tax=Strongyloides venezuelensis TaxID=75913 RepID=A0A0K0F204_STRVS
MKKRNLTVFQDQKPSLSKSFTVSLISLCDIEPVKISSILLLSDDNNDCVNDTAYDRVFVESVASAFAASVIKGFFVGSLTTLPESDVEAAADNCNGDETDSSELKSPF